MTIVLFSFLPNGKELVRGTKRKKEGEKRKLPNFVSREGNGGNRGKGNSGNRKTGKQGNKGETGGGGLANM